MIKTWKSDCQDRAIISARGFPNRTDDLGHIPGWIRIGSDELSGVTRFEVFRRLILRISPVDHTCAWYWQTKSGTALRIRRQPLLLRPLSDINVLSLLGQDLIDKPDDARSVQMPSPQECARAMTNWIESNEILRSWYVSWKRTLRGVLGSVLDLALLAEPGENYDCRTIVLELVWKNQWAFEDVRRNSPGVLPLMSIWLLAGHELNACESPLRTLKRAVSESSDCGSATWRWLQRWGMDPLLPLVRGATRDDGDRYQWAATIQVLELWTSAGLPPPIPRNVAEEWIRRIQSPQDLLACCRERLAIIAFHLDQHRSGPLSNAEIEGFADCLLKLAEVWPPLDRNQKRGGWNWLRRDIQRFPLNRPCDEPLCKNACFALTESITVSSVRFVPLMDLQAIEEEGRVLQHCMGDDPARFARSGDLHFSLRCQETGRHLATCSFSFEGSRLALRQLAGYKNASPCRRMFAAVKAFTGVLINSSEAGHTLGKELERNQISLTEV